MPELPEVETVRRGLEELIVGKTISKVDVFYPRMVVTGADDLKVSLRGQSLEKIGRRGKYLLFYFQKGLLISHLRMEGKYRLESRADKPSKHDHVFFSFTDGTCLVYQDVRKFGTMEWLDLQQEDDYFAHKQLGPEPKLPDFDLAVFKAQVVKSKKPIKSALLDQKLVVGLGNIYVDEVLFGAGIHPFRQGKDLKPKEISRLHHAILEMMERAIALGGSTIRTYHNAFGADGSMQELHKVYGKTGQPCQVCGQTIEKIKLGGRGTHFCPHCQKI